MSRRLPIERPNGAVEWIDVPDGEPAPYSTRNESDEPVDDRLAAIYHCARWAAAASQALELETELATCMAENERMRRALAHLADATTSAVIVDRIRAALGGDQ